jgi:hypothetical protein
MSDYYGAAELEDWLGEEVFYRCGTVPREVVALFEKWRAPVESSIEAWLDSDDGEGNCLSWRGWGRGWGNIPESELKEVGSAIEAGFAIITQT